MNSVSGEEKHVPFKRQGDDLYYNRNDQPGVFFPDNSLILNNIGTLFVGFVGPVKGLKPIDIFLHCSDNV